MLKHELAVIEVMRELHESREAAVRAERQRIINLLAGAVAPADAESHTQLVQDMRTLVTTLNRISERMEANPSRFLFGDPNESGYKPK